jgi:hypothetical protein
MDSVSGEPDEHGIYWERHPAEAERRETLLVGYEAVYKRPAHMVERENGFAGIALRTSPVFESD